MYEQVGDMNKGIENMKVNILELKSKIVKIKKKSLEGFNSRYKEADERTSKLIDMTTEIT